MLVDHLTPYDQALLVIDQVVFGGGPPALEAVRRAAGEERPIHEAPGHLFGPDDEGITSVLKAALSEWVDFRVLLSPPRHAVRADHDEYTTFFSESAGKIAEVRRDLERERIALPEYTAKAP